MYSEGSGFRNIDPDYDNYYLDDDLLMFSGRFIYQLSKGFLFGLVETLEIDELNRTTVSPTLEICTDMAKKYGNAYFDFGLEWDYLVSQYGYSDLEKIGEFWYAKK